ncbi:MAG: hypothetical protein SVC26_06450 [Pseudomonadota bacterium]|nr:hypothetical protein [Pseudomonadota bacterium]
MKTEVQIGTQRYTKVNACDEVGVGGAHHNYEIVPSEGGGVFAEVNFQTGGVNELGVNGCHNEDLIAIVIHRLQGFQSGDFSCRENALALTKLEEALHWLRHRTDARISRGVEGKNVV